MAYISTSQIYTSKLNCNTKFKPTTSYHNSQVSNHDTLCAHNVESTRSHTTAVNIMRLYLVKLGYAVYVQAADEFDVQI